MQMMVHIKQWLAQDFFGGLGSIFGGNCTKQAGAFIVLNYNILINISLILIIIRQLI